MRATWYVLEDGKVADPNECTSDEKGALTHKSGVKVAMRFPDCPMSRGVDVDERTGKLMFGGKGDHDGDGSVGGSAPKTGNFTTNEVRAASGLPPARTDMKPEPPPAAKPRRGYKTRETKAI